MSRDRAKPAGKLHYDRERVGAFLHFTWQRFIEDRCLQAAGALSFTTVFAIVPLTTAILGILAAFPGFADWRRRLTDFVFSNFVPAAGSAVQDYITQFAGNASKATVVGVLVLLFSAIALMMSIEDAFNRIWRVQTMRSASSRFVVYWSTLTLGPLLLVAAVAISSYLLALPFIGAAGAQFSLKLRVLSVLPFVIVWAALLAAYMAIPNRTVQFRHAVWGSLLAALLFEAAKRGFALYVTRYANYEQIYGALAMAPVFIIWIYLSWVIVLFGASITASLTAFDYRPATLHLPPGQEFAGLLRVLGHFAAAQRQGNGLHSDTLLAAEPYLTDDLLQRYLGDLHRAGLARRSENGEWVLVRDLGSATLLDIYEQGAYRLPLTEVRLAGDQRKRAGDLLAHLAGELRRGLDVPLSELFAPPGRSVDEPPDPDHPGPPAATEIS
ncbi:MAG TPA: YihY family inner membrane protein [Rhodanobacteraceae bacterium]|nr:YihY family inner membrane protein [Rhodanobacteraceae bacterium]